MIRQLYMLKLVQNVLAVVVDSGTSRTSEYHLWLLGFRLVNYRNVQVVVVFRADFAANDLELSVELVLVVVVNLDVRYSLQEEQLFLICFEIAHQEFGDLCFTDL
jgi:hypothetical protein